MRKIRCLALAILLVFAFGSIAQAVEGITMSLASVRDTGTLEVIASSGYTAEEDMNFIASTENGELEVRNAIALRDEGTSWFVILEYGSENRNENLRRASDDVMKGIAGLVLDIDDGALIPADGTSSINVQKAQQLRDVLSGQHGNTNYHNVPETLRSVMNYIYENRANLMPNVAVVLITQARLFSDEEMSSIQDTLNRYSTITTHVVCPVAESDRNQDWVDHALRVSQMGAGTLSGSGYVMRIKGQNSPEPVKAVENIRDLERSMLMLLLEPKIRNVNFIGQELTLTQITSGGKNLSTTGKLSNETYELWKQRIEENPESAETPDDPAAIRPSALSDHSSSYTFLYVPEEVKETKSGMSTELLIGIILGVVILALVVVLILVNRGKKKKKTATTAYGVPASSGSKSGGGNAPSGAKLSLQGDDGSSYSAAFRNNRVVIGRDGRKGATLAIPSDGKLSSVHVVVEKQGNQLIVTDQNSMNGTKVNGNKVTGPTVMNQNDTLGIGSHTYTVTWRG